MDLKIRRSDHVWDLARQDMLKLTTLVYMFMINFLLAQKRIMMPVTLLGMRHADGKPIYMMESSVSNNFVN